MYLISGRHTRKHTALRKIFSIRPWHAQRQHRYFFLVLKHYDTPLRRPEVKNDHRGCPKRPTSNFLGVSLKIAGG